MYINIFMSLHWLHLKCAVQTHAACKQIDSNAACQAAYNFCDAYANAFMLFSWKADCPLC